MLHNHAVPTKKTWILLLCLLSVAAGTWTLSTPQEAVADIGPGPGRTRVPVTHALDKIEGFEDYAFFLVSTNGRESWMLNIRPVSREGEDLNIPSSYMDHSVLAALTQAQVAELAKLALSLRAFDADREALKTLDDKALAAAFASRSWGTNYEEMEPFRKMPRTEVPLMAFFMRDDVATSHTLGFRAEVSSSSGIESMQKRWKVEAIADGEIILKQTNEKTLDEDGNLIVAPPSTSNGDNLSLWIGLGMLVAGVLLAVVMQLRATRGKSHAVA